MNILAIDKESTPYKGKAAVIPGTIKAVEFDEGGRNVSNFNALSSREFNRKRVYIAQDGSWLRYTVDVKNSCKYKAILKRNKVRDITRGTNFYPVMQLVLFVNNKIAGTFQCKEGDTETVLENIHLPAGKVKLTIMPLGGNEMCPNEITFTKQ